MYPTHPMPQTPSEPISAMLQHAPWARPLVPVRRLRKLHDAIRRSNSSCIFDAVLQQLQVTCRVTEADLARVPKTGACVVFANHPFGILDGILLGALLLRLRPDVKIMTNQMLAGVPELAPHCVWVDPFRMRSNEGMNRNGIRSSLQLLKQGGMLVVFPAGEVAHWSMRQWRVTDPAWVPMIARMARLTNAVCVPLHVGGHNSVSFQLAGMVHPRLRTLRLPKELLNKRGRDIEVRVGTPISPSTIDRSIGDDDFTSFLRWNTELLGHRDNVQKTAKIAWPKQPIAEETPSSRIAAEITSLPAGNRLETVNEYETWVLTESEAPTVVQEIGRLREIAFRGDGEGSGKQRDLDSFDAHYSHIVLWNRELQEIIGSYRVCRSDITKRLGVEGLYTSTLFDFATGLMERLGPAIELGRSFIRPEYQRQFSPLFLLWRGIGAFIARNPECPLLFGAVSISAEYTRASQELIVSFLQGHMADADLRRSIAPKNPRRRILAAGNHDAVLHSSWSLDELSARVSALEPDGKGIPVLLRHYLKLGGKILAFNVDEEFSNVLDALILVDLRRSKRSLVDRYLGKQGAEQFYAVHNGGSSLPIQESERH